MDDMSKLGSLKLDQTYQNIGVQGDIPAPVVEPHRAFSC